VCICMAQLFCCRLMCVPNSCGPLMDVLGGVVMVVKVGGKGSWEVRVWLLGLEWQFRHACTRQVLRIRSSRQQE
jgi:hypothetical protein